MVQVMLQAKHRVVEIAEQYGLTMMQSNVLLMLGDGKELPMNSISIHLACDASNVTGLVDRLEVQGLLERRDNPKDRRVKMIALTTKGEALRTTIVNKVAVLETEALMPTLTPEEVETLRAILQKLLVSRVTATKVA